MEEEGEEEREETRASGAKVRRNESAPWHVEAFVERWSFPGVASCAGSLQAIATI